ncbi:MAG: exo-alpha-sialidase [Planctomycetes bacterium]|nr:exo-alpha-sialidase [Planctomycetota bacterium]
MIRHPSRVLFAAALAIAALSLPGALPIAPADDRARPPAVVDILPSSGDWEQPQIAVDPKGNVFVAAVSGDRALTIVAMKTGASAFGKPVRVGVFKDMACGMRRGPRIAATAKELVISFVQARFNPGARKMEGTQNLVAYRSTDGGASWKGPVTINDTPTSAKEGLHAMASAPDGTIYALWLDSRDGEKGNQPYLSKSTDGGATFSKNVRVYASPSGSICECCHPSLAVGADGEVFAMFRNRLKGNRDMWLATSKDQGETWGDAAKLGDGTWPIDT